MKSICYGQVYHGNKASLQMNAQKYRPKPATTNAVFRMSSANVNAATLAKVGSVIWEVDAESGKLLRGKPKPLAVLTMFGACLAQDYNIFPKRSEG